MDVVKNNKNVAHEANIKTMEGLEIPVKCSVPGTSAQRAGSKYLETAPSQDELSNTMLPCRCLEINIPFQPNCFNIVLLQRYSFRN